MTKEFIRYRGGYKYQLAEDYSIQTGYRLESEVDEDFIKLTGGGLLTVKKGYAWDGPTGVPDDPKAMRASLVHDALYQLMRRESLDHRKHRKMADKLFRRICRKDGDSFVDLQYRAVRFFGESGAEPEAKRPIHRAPPA